MVQGRWRRKICRTLLLLTAITLNLWLAIRMYKNQPRPIKCPEMSYHVPPLPEKTPVSMNCSCALNISWDHGHWDKQRLFKTFVFISVGRNFTRLSQQYTVTLATQSSVEKVHSIVQMALQWTGPISAALYAAGDDEYSVLTVYISYLQHCFTSIRDRVAFHLTVPKDRVPTGQPSDNIKRPETYDCQKPEAFLKTLLRSRSQATVRWRLKHSYPQNHLRNTARKTSQTFFVFLTDIDIVPSTNFAERLDNFLKSPSRICTAKCAYVIPTYELDDRATFPWSKKDLIRLSKKGLARPFHQKVFIFNQYATNFSKWEKFLDADEDRVVVSHNVTNYEFLYEPFYVAADTVPEHDERFIGYGYTRNSQVWEMDAAGYQFQVLSPIFTIHWGLQAKKGRPAWRERQNMINRKYFDAFKKEVHARYGIKS